MSHTWEVPASRAEPSGRRQPGASKPPNRLAQRPKPDIETNQPGARYSNGTARPCALVCLIGLSGPTFIAGERRRPRLDLSAIRGRGNREAPRIVRPARQVQGHRVPQPRSGGKFHDAIALPNQRRARRHHRREKVHRPPRVSGSRPPELKYGVDTSFNGVFQGGGAT
jgi:hypothetical protein